MVREAIAESSERQGALSCVANQLGIRAELLRSWVKQADVDIGRNAVLSFRRNSRYNYLPCCLLTCGACDR